MVYFFNRVVPHNSLNCYFHSKSYILACHVRLCGIRIVNDLFRKMCKLISKEKYFIDFMDKNSYESILVNWLQVEKEHLRSLRKAYSLLKIESVRQN